MQTTGVGALLHMLRDAGVQYIFGNPGTTELPLNDALVDFTDIQYILGLQETPVAAMADGYAMASRGLGVVNLHIACGLGAAMGMIYNAHREGTPLLVTAGQQDRRLAFEEPILGGDLVGVAKPWTKYAVEVTRAADLPTAVRRAVQAALTPPTGPVFLSLPVDLQSELADYDVTPPTPLDHEVHPPPEAIAAAADLLLAAENPLLLAGSRVVESDAVDELVRLAELLGAPVASEAGTTHGRLGFPCDHPLYNQGMPLWSPEVRERLAPHDVLFVCGMDVFRQYVYHEPARALPEHVRVVHLDEDPYQLGKNYPLAAPLLGATRPGLTLLADAIADRLDAKLRARFAERATAWTRRHAEAREALLEKCRVASSAAPLAPLALMHAVADSLPLDVAVVEEAVTTTNTTLERLGALKNPTGYFGHRGWALGWGLGCAIGAKLAWPDRPVLALLGDGAAAYGVQGLWTAARYRIPVVFLICNNAQYQILKIGAQSLGLPAANDGKFVGLDLDGPEIDYLRLAESFGVKAQRVESAEELRAVLPPALQADEPLLIEAPIERTTPRRMQYG